MLRSVLFILLFAILSCSPQDKPKDSVHTKRNSKEIKRLEAQIKKLNSELEKTKSLESGGEVTREDLRVLREELLNLISDLDKKIKLNIDELESDLNKYKLKLNQENDKYVSITDFQLLSDKLNSEIQKRENYIKLQVQNSQNSDTELLRLEIAQLQEKQNLANQEFQAYLEKALEAWKVQLNILLTKNNQEITEEIRVFITDEISRIKTTMEGLSIQKDNTPSGSVDSNAINIVLKKHSDLITELQELVAQSSEPQITSDILNKLYEPCLENLKDDKYCYTHGSIINKLGGIFIDPTKFDRNKDGLLRYLSLSGVTLKAATHKIDSYIMPSSSNRGIFKECHENDDFDALIAPQKKWPKLVIISLILGKISDDLTLRKDMNLIDDDIKPISYYAAWWRSRCYNKKLNAKLGVPESKKSDHLVGSAVDFGFADQANQKTFNFYRSFIEDHIWNDDVFDILFPLKNSGLEISIGIGLGHGGHKKGKIHMGLVTENPDADNRRQWTYGNYEDLLD